MRQANVRNINAPDVVGMLRCDTSQQVRENLVLGCWFACMRTRNQGKNAHCTHGALDRGTGHTEFGPQLSGDLSGAIIGMLRVDLIDPPLDRQLPFRGRHWLIEQAGVAEAQQFGLHLQR